MSASDYSADSIASLDGREGVRKRPDMYIGDRGSDGFHHCAFEIIDNSIDEHLAGFASTVTVRLVSPDVLEVMDDGRGIPVDMHPKEKIPAVEVVLTKLHAGGKFDLSSYKVSGGLHGVGLSVVNALAAEFEIEVYRDGKIYYMKFEEGKKVDGLKVIGKTDKRGTFQRFRLDNSIFQINKFSPGIIKTRLRELAFLNAGLKVVFENCLEEDPENPDQHMKYEFKFDEGIAEFVREELNQNEDLLFPYPIRLSGEQEGQQVEVVFQYRNTGAEPDMYSYVNSIHTKNHGIHVDGFWMAYEKVMQNFAMRLGIDKKGEKVSRKTLSFGLTLVVNCRIPNAEFKGQTKDKLTEPVETRRIVRDIVENQLSLYFEKNMPIAEKILKKAVLELKALQEAEKAREGVRSNLGRGRKNSLSIIAGKLADCSTRKRELRELFIVEGDSAGGSAKQGRDREIQAILPLRGKILNVEKKLDKKSLQPILNNNEIKTMIAVLGAGYYNNFDISKLQYNKVIIMTDADVDGSHIRILLLTFFYRFMRPLLEEGHVFIALPPLYKIGSGKKAAYAYSDEERDSILKTDFKGKKPDIQRYKGLGEMNPEQLWNTTMDPENRKMLKVSITDFDEAEHLLKLLMSDQADPESRKKFIRSNVNFVTNIDDIG